MSTEEKNLTEAPRARLRKAASQLPRQKSTGPNRRGLGCGKPRANAHGSKAPEPFAAGSAAAGPDSAPPSVKENRAATGTDPAVLSAAECGDSNSSKWVLRGGCSGASPVIDCRHSGNTV